MEDFPTRVSAATLARIHDTFTADLYDRMHAFWYQDVPPASVHAPAAAVQKWFGLSPEDNRALFDTACVQFRPALTLISPEVYPLPPAASSYAGERAQDLAIAAPFFGPLSPFHMSGSSSTDSKKSVSAAQARRALGLVILLDQMPRNLFREDQALVYTHYDRIARAVLYTFLNATARPDTHGDVAANPLFRTFWYLPLSHSERLEDHIKHKELMAECRAEVQRAGIEEAIKWLDISLRAEEEHVDIIRQFGRYPHRNEHLGRITTPEEADFLLNGGSTFGTESKVE